MGGFTKIKLEDTSEISIRSNNSELAGLGVPKKYRFYSELNVRKEFEYFKRGEGNFPKYIFEGISTYQAFKRKWLEWTDYSIGALHFDCYYGRTSQRAMRLIGKFVYRNQQSIKSVSGSFDTFIERGMTEKEIKNLNIKR